tara:strand:+ start:546 stop:776 length:231 start_codon:yes stop_codon:yes gene_type:complete
MIRVIWEYLKEGWPYTLMVVALAILKLTYLPCIGWWLVLLPLYFWWPFVILLVIIVGTKTLFEELVIEKIKKWLKK